MTSRPAGQRKLPGRRRISFRDDPRSWASVALPQRRSWPLTALFTFFAVVLLTMTGFDIAAVVRYFTAGDSQFSGPIFDLFSAIIWGSFGLVALAVALMLGIGGQEIRVGHGLMVHVARIGPLRVFNEIDLADVRNVRTEGHGDQGDSRVYFDYGDLTLPFGSPQPGESAGLGVELIQRAIAAGGGESLPPPVVPLVSTAPPAASQPVARSAAWLPIAFLVGANLFTVFGVLALGWDLGQVMVLFWAENLVIGIYGVAKVIIVERWLAVISAPFFVGHFGLFTALHFIFVYYLFVAGLKGPKLEASVVLALLAPLWTAILAIFVSHGVSFCSNFLGRREYLGRKAGNQTIEPYKRLMLLHFTILLGGWAVIALGQPIYALLLLVVLKIGMDLSAHLKEHRGQRDPEGRAPTAA